MTPPIKIDDDVKEAVKKEQSEAINRRYVIPPPKTEMFKPSGHYFQTLLNARLKEKDDKLEELMLLSKMTEHILDNDEGWRQAINANQQVCPTMQSAIKIVNERDQLKQQLLSQALTIERMRWALKKIEELAYGGKEENAIYVIANLITTSSPDTSHLIYERIMSFWSRQDNGDIQRTISFDACDREMVTKELVEFII